ncbi:uncharacterized protein LOC118195447 [Stegodyphus dumicola]|uniref:uncharacterized protein LOC118195447 n=1 Tax=Stegodyphus dumicola TaxID=202533 RepID=UPI0015B029D0|nr:uncharacterized protein LOC118195447 [Stegodyphus dumicola]
MLTAVLTDPGWNPGEGCFYIKGRIVVVKVEEGSVAAEEDQIEPGDVLDELYGQSLYRCNRSLISSLSNKYRGLPIYLSVIKVYHDGKIFFPLKPLLEKLDIRELVERKLSKNNEPSDEVKSEFTSGCLVFQLLLLGRFLVKNDGRAQNIEIAINKALDIKLEPKDVIMEITERDLKVIEKKDNNVMLHKHFSEISACGRKKICPEIFAFIFGNTTCTIANEFQCFVLQAPSHVEVGTILSSVAHGFVKTHWEV